jgi:hypothetical protein
MSDDEEVNIRGDMKNFMRHMCLPAAVFLLAAVMAAGQTLVIEGTEGRREYAAAAVRDLRFAELDSLSNAALSLHTTTGIRQLRLADIDSLAFRDSTQLVIYHGGEEDSYRHADIEYADITPLCLPDRPEGARSGSEFMEDIPGMSFSEREPLILAEILSGNIPDIARTPVTLTSTFTDANGIACEVEYDVMTDCLSIGTNMDHCRIPMGPETAQQIADAFGCILTTRKLCDDIWRHATVRLTPIPYAPVGNNNEQVYKFVEHNGDINAAREAAGGSIHELIAGIKKDVVICNAIKDKPDRVAIYGWHYTSGSPIQPLYTGHYDSYVDYSHGIRLVNAVIRVDGIPMHAEDILKDPVLYKLLSDENGIMEQPRYSY